MKTTITMEVAKAGMKNMTRQITACVKLAETEEFVPVNMYQKEYQKHLRTLLRASGLL